MEAATARSPRSPTPARGLVEQRRDDLGVVESRLPARFTERPSRRRRSRSGSAPRLRAVEPTRLLHAANAITSASKRRPGRWKFVSSDRAPRTRSRV
jgi:hypothetical protein